MKVDRRKFGQISALTLGGGILSAQDSSQRSYRLAKQPNVVFICSDQHSGRMLMGGPGEEIPVSTPNLRRMASAGVWFKNAYTVSPVCVPGRAALMTGRYSSDVGSYCNSTVFDGRVPTWGNYLRQNGYQCLATGKLDLTAEADMGFEQVKTSHEHFRNPDITSLFRRPLCFRVDERILVDGEVGEPNQHDLDITQFGVDFIRNKAPGLGKPWALYLGMTTPHPKFTVPKQYMDAYPSYAVQLPNIPPGYLENQHLVFQAMRNHKLISTPIPEERIRRARSAYYGLVTALDENVGRILDEIERTGRLSDTLVVYTSDHGEMLGAHGLWLKNVLLEGAARVPLLLAGAGLPKGKLVDAPVSHVDLVATVLDMAGIQRPKGLRGHSLLPLAHGDPTNDFQHVYAESHSEGNCTGSFMIRKGEWKYIYFSGYGDNLLFDLSKDPEELNNLFGKEKFRAIERDLHDILTSLVDPDPITERAFEVQEQFLARMVRDLPPEKFFDRLAGRLGLGQALMLTKKYYPKQNVKTEEMPV